jgi:hypothetical protein
LTDRFGDKSEIDVVYGLFWKRYIECKTYSSKLVPLSDVAKFKEVLQLNKIPIERGIVITTGDYAPRCRNIGIECWDGRDFQKQERKWIWIRRARVGVIQTLVIASVAVFAHSAWDKSYDTHDAAEKARKLVLSTSTQAYETVKGWYNKYTK